MPLLDHVHGFDACDDGARTTKRLESEHRSHEAFDGAMILLDDVVEVLRLAQLDVCAGVGANALDGRRVGTALVDGDLLGHAVPFDGTFEESPRRSEVSVSPKQKVDRGTGTVDGSVQVLPLAADFDLGSSIRQLMRTGRKRLRNSAANTGKILIDQR